MKKYLLLVFFIALSLQTNKDLQVDKVFEIEQSSLQFIVNQMKFTCVLFYNGDLSPEIESILADLAINITEQRLQSHKQAILFGKLDISQNQELNQLYELAFGDKNYQFVIFNGQKRKNFSGLFSYESLYKFIDEFSDRNIYKLEKQSQIEEFFNQNNQKRVLIGSNNSTYIEQLQNWQEKKDLFAQTCIENVKLIEDIELLDSLDLGKQLQQPFMLFLKDDQFKEEQKMHFFQGNSTEFEEIKTFLQVECVNLVEIISEKNYLNVFGQSINKQVNIFLDESKNNSFILQEFQKAALYNKEEELKYERFAFVIHYFNKENRIFMQNFDIYKQEQLPVIAISLIDYSSFGLTKYIFDRTEINSENIIHFMEKARTKQIEPHYRSENIEEEKKTSGIMKLVGKNFRETIFRQKKSVFVLFWDSKDTDSSREYFELLKQFKLKIPSFTYEHLLILSTFDLDKNESDLVNLDRAPLFMVYPQGYKHKPQTYSGPIKLENIRDFLNYWVRDLKIEIPLPLGSSQNNNNQQEL